MDVDIFDFELDRGLIATEPASPRDNSRLLDLSVENKISDRKFFELPDLLEEGDVLVFNNTKVIPAKLYGAKGEAQIETTLYRPVDGINWWAFIKNSKRLREGDTISFYTNEISPEHSDFSAKVVEKKGEEGVLLKFGVGAGDLGSYLQKYGSMPLPPYIKRDKLENRNDTENYQTIYAEHEGAVAAPTAGLHFTEEVMKRLDEKGIKKTFLTLHVGAGTFLPVKVQDTKDHKMHSEYGIIAQDSCDMINNARKSGKRIVAVGTTSLRLLESATDENGITHPFTNDTSIFITPGYKFKSIDMMITNFHLPKSTLFMLVCAVAGIDKMKEAYRHAIKNKYRFYSYGDSSIIKCVNKI
ncbi:MAG: tRNA preQ1(34) S-adenosylmethionine ribosyltransferase-isomerase QueA [Lactobacillaceae bacterium]|jgi:S-adenosylmethionine:tRNA ribosyltransferase-isomerase|nr:tRNA preQ1(34) S-adenosylmethionine ribosyltransferase-isomerase QueA [Lactobacillaceae bacterium]